MDGVDARAVQAVHVHCPSAEHERRRDRRVCDRRVHRQLRADAVAALRRDDDAHFLARDRTARRNGRTPGRTRWRKPTPGCQVKVPVDGVEVRSRGQRCEAIRDAEVAGESRARCGGRQAHLEAIDLFTEERRPARQVRPARSGGMATTGRSRGARSRPIDPPARPLTSSTSEAPGVPSNPGRQLAC